MNTTTERYNISKVKILHGVIAKFWDKCGNYGKSPDVFNVAKFYELIEYNDSFIEYKRKMISLLTQWEQKRGFTISLVHFIDSHDCMYEFRRGYTKRNHIGILRGSSNEAIIFIKPQILQKYGDIKTILSIDPDLPLNMENNIINSVNHIIRKELPNLNKTESIPVVNPTGTQNVTIYNVYNINYRPESDNLPFTTLTLDKNKLGDIDTQIYCDPPFNGELTPVANIKKITKWKIKNIVWERYGNVNPDNQNEGKCFCCNKVLLRNEPSTNLGHIIPKSKGGKYTIENIRPICIMCNLGSGGMHTMHMYEYIIKKNLYGIKYLSEEDKKSYVYNVDEKEILIEKCYIKLGILLTENIITKSVYDHFDNILKTKEAITKDFQAVIRYIGTFN